MKSFVFKSVLFLYCFISFSFYAHAQSSWPLTGANENKSVSVFKPVAESYSGNNLNFRAAVAIYENNNDPVFGAIWGDSRIENNNGKMSNVRIADIRFPDGLEETEKTDLILLIQQTFNSKQPMLDIQDINADINNANREREFEAGINNTPPKIIYAKESSLLVSIDGDPIINSTSASGIEAVVNTPFLILKYQNNFYLSNGELWYKAGSATGNYLPEKNTPKAVKDMAKSLKTDEQAVAESKGNFYPKIIISTVPAELIQTEGEPQFSPIEGINLLFVSNTEDQILFDIDNQLYYVLLSGRWYASNRLDGSWSYVEPQKLPADFAKIPEGSDKDVVLASVPGTKASQEAIKDAQIPHTAIVNRSTTRTEVEYDGDPAFEIIQGTNIQLATNSSGTVLLEGNTYFLVDDGVWFTSNSPDGPWVVSDYRPQHVNDIPPSSPAYNVKYVNIYHSTPEVVYVGYTSGYISNYVVGPVIVYGTGHYYRPWKGRYYFPRPRTWGFGMYYNPWYGWSMNISYGIGGYGWFGFYSPWRPHHWGHHRYMGCGWWGPPVYRPPYGIPYNHYYGHRSATNRAVRYGTNVSVRRETASKQVHNNNIYNYNRVGVTPTRGNVSSPDRQNTNTRENNYNYGNRARPADLTKEVDKRPVYNNTDRQRPSGTVNNTQNANRQPSQNNNNSGNTQNTNRQPASNTQTRPANNSNNTNRNNNSTARPANTNKNNQNTYQRPSTQPTQNNNRQSINRSSDTPNTNRQSTSNQKQNNTRENTNNSSRQNSNQRSR
ncbi:MAG: hypothetical protein LBQ22_08360 [Bacteroidales bacterium]|jgi:hypothetical protein|nr:hypothetical protein [Bacteroidales bacterium]